MGGREHRLTLQVAFLDDVAVDQRERLQVVLLGERALVIRGQDGVVRAFMNLCRHRGARVVDGAQGKCRGALVCPFHGWVYNLDGSLRGVSRPDTFGEGLDKSAFGLKPLELEIFIPYTLTIESGE